MIKVIRRWSIPTEKRQTFVEFWAMFKQVALRQPGCVGIEMFRSEASGHYVSIVTWETEAHRKEALKRAAKMETELRQYERDREVLVSDPDFP